MFSEKRANKRKKKKQEGTYGFWDFVGDVLSSIPDLVFLPFRLVYWLFRFLLRSVFDVF